MTENINQFIIEQSCATICCLNEQGTPYCFNCFYAFDKQNGMLYFKSSPTSNHAEMLKNSTSVAGTILPDKLSKLLIKGLQFEGEILQGNDPLMKSASAFYHKAHPIGLTMPGQIWIIQIANAKLTDNSKGFGHKEVWQREDSSLAYKID